MRLYFANGGGPCYVVSVGADSAPVTLADHQAGLTAAGREDEPTLIVFPDALRLTRSEFYQIYQAALSQCNDLKDRFTICDIFNGHLDYTNPTGENVIDHASLGFRSLIGNNFLIYERLTIPNWLRRRYVITTMKRR